MPMTSDPALVAALTESLMSLAGPRRWDKSVAYSRAIAAAITAHPAVIAYVEGLRDVAEKARRVDAAGGERTAEFDEAMRDLHVALDRLAEATGGSNGNDQP
jgi:hypothetical protein